MSQPVSKKVISPSHADISSLEGDALQKAGLPVYQDWTYTCKAERDAVARVFPHTKRRKN